MDGHGATIATIPLGATGVWEPGKARRRKRGVRQGIARKPGSSEFGSRQRFTPQQEAALGGLTDEWQTAGEIAERVGLPREKVRHPLYTLAHKGYAERDLQGRFRLAPELEAA